MMLTLRTVLAVFFAFWLPFSAVAAAMMPMCVHEGAKQMQAAHGAEQGCEQQQGVPDKPAGVDGVAGGDCAQCGLCLFACTPWLPSTQSSFEANSSFAMIDGIFAVLHSIVFPPADRPPLAAA